MSHSWITLESRQILLRQCEWEIIKHTGKIVDAGGWWKILSTEMLVPGWYAVNSEKRIQRFIVGPLYNDRQAMFTAFDMLFQVDFKEKY